MSLNNNKSNKQNLHSQNSKNVVISSNEIEQFKTMLDNYGNELIFINDNYNKLIDCK